MSNSETKRFTIGLRNCQISYFSGTGPGGQHRNKTINCVRLFHEPSGVRITAQSHREKRSNELDAMRRLSVHPSFKYWASERLKEMEGRETVAQWVEEQMKPENIEIEYL